MSSTGTGYRAYLLRLWRSPDAAWRATLEDAHTGERRAFGSAAELVAFLEAEGTGPGRDTPARSAASEQGEAAADVGDASLRHNAL